MDHVLAERDRMMQRQRLDREQALRDLNKKRAALVNQQQKLHVGQSQR